MNSGILSPRRLRRALNGHAGRKARRAPSPDCSRTWPRFRSEAAIRSAPNATSGRAAAPLAKRMVSSRMAALHGFRIRLSPDCTEDENAASTVPLRR
jgi:hypothetical protein